MKERPNKYFLIWTKFDSVNAGAGVHSFYGEIYESLTTVLLPVASLTVCRWYLSLESLTHRIVIFRPFLWIREVISVDVVIWNVKEENLRLRSYSVLGNVMTFLTWRRLDLGWEGDVTGLCQWWVIIPPSSLLELPVTSHFPSKQRGLLRCCSLAVGPTVPGGQGHFSLLLLPRAWEIYVVWIRRNVTDIHHKYPAPPPPALKFPEMTSYHILCWILSCFLYLKGCT